jgi:Tn3 transposase DDE domain-containing protein
VAADTAADSDLIHGLFRLLGYQFSPRRADLPRPGRPDGGHNWRLDRHADYGPLNRLAVYRINWAKIWRFASDLGGVWWSATRHRGSAMLAVSEVADRGSPCWRQTLRACARCW